MSYLGPIAILLLVLAPLALPVTVTVVHAAGGWWRNLRTSAGVMNHAVRRVGPQRLGRQLSTSHADRTDLTGRHELGWQFAE